MYSIASSPLPSSASYSSDSQLSSHTPFRPLSPDVAPLLPSPGGLVPTTGTSMPTIPSNPSPPNPDSAFPPFGSLPESSTSPRLSFQSIHLASTFSVLVVVPYCLMQLVTVL
ncbi:hypothetical protein V6N11_018871 [Hibiscus sabdariffa]